MQAQEIRLRERDQRNGHEWPGEIHLKLNTRTTKSRYYTIRYAPMESLMAWPKGSYELMKFIDPSGKMKFELVLRPEVF